jgi:hypothetical protein
MSRTRSAAVDRALARVKSGETVYRAAKNEGVAQSSVHRAIKREAFASINRSNKVGD